MNIVSSSNDPTKFQKVRFIEKGLGNLFIPRGRGLKVFHKIEFQFPVSGVFSFFQ